MGAIWGDIPLPNSGGGNRGGYPPASLSRVYSPPPQQRGVPMGDFQYSTPTRPQPQACPGAKGGSPTYGACPPIGGPDGTPLLGGGSFCSEFAGKFAGNHRIFWD